MLPEEQDAEEILNPVVLSVGTVEWVQWLQPLSFAPQVLGLLWLRCQNHKTSPKPGFHPIFPPLPFLLSDAFLSLHTGRSFHVHQESLGKFASVARHYLMEAGTMIQIPDTL